MTDKKTKGWKNAALGAMVFLTGLSSSLNAAAQKTTERDPQKDKTEILHSPQSAEDAYWENTTTAKARLQKYIPQGKNRDRPCAFPPRNWPGRWSAPI